MNELDSKTLKTLVITTFILSVFAILFSIASLMIGYNGSSIIEHTEFDDLEPGIKRLYRDAALGDDGFKPYIHKINDKYRKAADAAGGEDKLNEVMIASIRNHKSNNTLITYVKSLFDSLQFH
jgi:hypothetical protein